MGVGVGGRVAVELVKVADELLLCGPCGLAL